MPRPFFNHSYQQLEALFDEGRVSIEDLTLLRNELVHRNSNKAKKLLEAVKEALNTKHASVLLPHRTPATIPDGEDELGAPVETNTSSQTPDDDKDENPAGLTSHRDVENNLEHLEFRTILKFRVSSPKFGLPEPVDYLIHMSVKNLET